MVNHWYFYGFDAGFGPFYLKFCGYFPYTGQIYIFSELCKPSCKVGMSHQVTVAARVLKARRGRRQRSAARRSWAGG